MRRKNYNVFNKKERQSFKRADKAYVEHKLKIVSSVAEFAQDVPLVEVAGTRDPHVFPQFNFLSLRINEIAERIAHTDFGTWMLPCALWDLFIAA